MAQKTVGVAITAPDPSGAVAQIRKAEDSGVAAAWLTSIGAGGGDAMSAFAVAAAQTERILLGTSVVQTWSRHPITLAQQTQVIADLAPGRFRLGVGPGHKTAMEQMFGADFHAPVGHLIDYMRILKALLHEGTVDFDGQHYTAHSSLSGPVDVPLMASALRLRSFELCGDELDGAISWVCPLEYLRDVALPAMKAAARRAGRESPPLIVHAPICVHEDLDAVRAAVREQMSYYPSATFYSLMFAAAGFTETKSTGWTPEMMDAVVISGDETTVARRIEEIFEWGGSEVLASIVTVGDAEKSWERTARVLAQVSG